MDTHTRISAPHQHTVLTMLILLALLMALCSAAPAAAQDVLHIQPGSTLTVDGTSNKSDWTVHASEITGTLTVGETAGEVMNARIVVPSGKIASKKSTIMDRLMHSALKADEHPEIVYELTTAESAGAPQSNAFTLRTQGNLTLAGVTKPIRMDVRGEWQADGSVRLTGSYALAMTDYSMQPPTAMFGALHTGDEVTVRFDVIGAPAPAQ